MTVYWGRDFGIRLVALGAIFAAVGLWLSTQCTLTLTSNIGPPTCVEYGHGLWWWAILLSGIALVILGLVSVATD